MHIAIILISLLSIVSPAYAKEITKIQQQNLLEECPLSDSLCSTDAIVQKSPTVFEPLKLERVVDGDTISASGRKIRLWGINTPEKNEPGYLAATWLLGALVKEGELTCRLVDIDRYKREVRHCLIDGLDIGSMMVKAGMAKDYAQYSGGYYRHEQSEAKADKRGIWKLQETKKSK